MPAFRTLPVSRLAAHAAEILTDLAQRCEPVVITQDGEARAVLVDAASYQETRNTIALLVAVVRSDRDVEEGMVKPVEDVVKRLREKKKGA